MSADIDHQPGQAAWFATTHWSVVLAARDASERKAQAALETLCRSYWHPIYAYLRRTGHGPHDAQDLAQGFFARLIADDDLRSIGNGVWRCRGAWWTGCAPVTRRRARGLCSTHCCPAWAGRAG